jgi:hypothetical protein
MQLRFIVPIAAAMALVLMSCSDSSPRPTPTPPAGWDSFDDTGFSGALPDDWDYWILPQDEFLELAREGLTESRLKSAAVDSINDAAPEDFAETVLFVLMGKDDFPNINVQPCAPDLRSKSINNLQALYEEELGVDVQAAGEIEYQGEQSTFLKARMFDGVDTYQTIVGRSGCYSIVTLTALPSNAGAITDWKRFMAHLVIDDSD